jgi:hypothetical protein
VVRASGRVSIRAGIRLVQALEEGGGFNRKGKERVSMSRFTPALIIVNQTVIAKEGIDRFEAVKFYRCMDGGLRNHGIALAHAMNSASANYTRPEQWVSRFIVAFLNWTYESGGVQFGSKLPRQEDPEYVYTIDVSMDFTKNAPYGSMPTKYSPYWGVPAKATMTVDRHGVTIFSGNAWEYEDKFTRK